jgi:hypothetical protein
MARSVAGYPRLAKWRTLELTRRVRRSGLIEDSSVRPSYVAGAVLFFQNMTARQWAVSTEGDRSHDRVNHQATEAEAFSAGVA